MRQTRSLPRRARRAGRHLGLPRDRRARPHAATRLPIIKAIQPQQVWLHLTPLQQAGIRQTLRQILQEVIRDVEHC
jgi:hypothetical protein